MSIDLEKATEQASEMESGQDGGASSGPAMKEQLRGQPYEAQRQLLAPSATQGTWIPDAGGDAAVLERLQTLGYSVANLKQWRIRGLRLSGKPYRTYAEVAEALGLSLSGAGALSPSVPVTPEVQVKDPEVVEALSAVAQVSAAAVEAPSKVPTPKASVVPPERAKAIASRFMMAAEQVSARKPMIDTGRVKIRAPQDDKLVVYRAEKAERNTLEARRKQGGLTIWRPSSASVQEAYDQMFALISGGATLGEFQFKAALNAYAQGLRAEGQPDNLATARTVEGAYNDDFNYTVTIPGVRLFKWTPTGIGDRIAPGAEIKQHYIVLDADTLKDATVFGIGHVTGTQEVSFYTALPASMITSVAEAKFGAAAQTFVVPAGAPKG